MGFVCYQDGHQKEEALVFGLITRVAVMTKPTPSTQPIYYIET